MCFILKVLPVSNWLTYTGRFKMQNENVDTYLKEKEKMKLWLILICNH